MSETDLTAKARRAAEWLKARDTVKFSPEIRKGTKVRWLIQALNTGVYFERTDREFIAFCEDRGWQDQEQEADGVEWVTTITDQAEMPSPMPETYGTLELTVIHGPWTKDEWYWDVSEIGIVPVASGTAPTRAEARRQAVEAARGMG